MVSIIFSTFFFFLIKHTLLCLTDCSYFRLNSYDFAQVEQACSALSSLASDRSVAMSLMKSDIMQPVERVLKSADPEELISVLQVVVQLAFTSNTVAKRMLTKDLLKSLKLLCAHKNPEASSLFFQL